VSICKPDMGQFYTPPTWYSTFRNSRTSF